MSTKTRAARAVAIAGITALFTLTSAARAETITPRAALQAISAAGYGGAGGVTLSGNYYFATALTRKGKKVRIGVDARSGTVTSVEPLRRGAGAVTPPAPGYRTFVSPRIEMAPSPPMADPYVPPDDSRPIGAPYRPFTPSGQPVSPLCRYNPNGPGC